MNPALLPSLPPCLLLIPLLSARPSSPFYTSGDMFPADDGEEGKGGKKICSLRSSLFLLHVFLFVCFFGCCFFFFFTYVRYLSLPLFAFVFQIDSLSSCLVSGRKCPIHYSNPYFSMDIFLSTFRP